MLQRLHRTDPPARDSRHVVERQVSDESEQHDGSLVVRQRVDGRLQLRVGNVVVVVVEDCLLGEWLVGGD